MLDEGCQQALRSLLLCKPIFDGFCERIQALAGGGNRDGSVREGQPSIYRSGDYLNCARLADSETALADYLMTRAGLVLNITIEVWMMANRKLRWQDVALPIVLCLTGAILIGADWFGYLSLDRIQQLWPAAFILTGLVELAPVENRNR